MASAFTRKQAADAVAKTTGERDAIRANLLDLDGSFGKRLLEGAALTGITRQRWDSAAVSLAALWRLFDAYSAVIDRAAEMLAGRLGQEKLAEITALLTGPSIELHRPAPLGGRDLADTGREQVSITTGRARMSAAFAEVTEDPFLVGQQLLEQPQRLCPMPALPGPEGDVAAGGQGVWVVRAKDPLSVGQQLTEQPLCLRRMPAHRLFPAARPA
jgi:hypothetical protein